MPKGVFCLEGDWEGLKDHMTVEPMLELLHNMHNHQVKYIHRNIATLQQFDYYMAKWTQQGQKNYPILYLGFHGMPNTIFLGDQRKAEGKITLEWIEERLKKKNLRRKIIFFGTCETLNISNARLHKFVQKTGVAAICGYKSSVNWTYAAAFEIIVLDNLQYFTTTQQGLKAVKKRIYEAAGGLAKKLKFSMVLRST
ncbi:MAG: DUF6642 family protein [bacterium]